MINTTAEAKKGKGIEELIDKLIMAPPEEQKAIASTPSEKYNTLFLKFHRVLDYSRSIGLPYRECPPDLLEEIYEVFTDDILTPTEINEFLQLSILYEQHKHYQKTLPHILTELIRNSYRKAGYTKFKLTTKALTNPLNYFGYSLYPGPGEPPSVSINIEGDLGSFCGNESTGVQYTVSGRTGAYCGVKAIDCSFTLGNFDVPIALRAHDSVFTLRGKLIQKRVNLIHEIFDRGVSMKGCVFQVYDPKTYKALKQMIDQRKNRIELVGEN